MGVMGNDLAWVGEVIKRLQQLTPEGRAEFFANVDFGEGSDNAIAFLALRRLAAFYGVAS